MTENSQSSLFREYGHPRYWGTWCLLGLLYSIAHLPLSWQRGLGRLFGSLGYYLMPSRRHIASVNLALCFPDLSEDERRALLKQCFHDNAIGYFEAASAWFTPAERFRPITDAVGLEHFEKALNAGKGVILFGGHFSVLDLSGALFDLYGKAASMQRDHDNPLFNAVMTRSRAKFCHPIIGKDDLRALMKILRNGDVIWYATDQDYGRKGCVFAPFFGVPAATLTTSARIAAKTGAALVPFSCFRLPNGRYQLNFEPALDNYPSGDDVIDATRTNAALERAVRRYPSQYLWMHRRFKTEPDGTRNRRYKRA